MSDDRPTTATEKGIRSGKGLRLIGRLKAWLNGSRESKIER